VKKQAELPEDERAFLNSLSKDQRNKRLRALWETGWSLSVLGNSLLPKRGKTTIHFWIVDIEAGEQRRLIPEPPPKSLSSLTPLTISAKVRSISPAVPPHLKPKIKELSKLSKRYRARTPENSPFAIANKELTDLARSLREKGVPTSIIAEAAGVSYRAMAKRLSK
jgi:hypothetical protein